MRPIPIPEPLELLSLEEIADALDHPTPAGAHLGAWADVYNRLAVKDEADSAWLLVRAREEFARDPA